MKKDNVLFAIIGLLAGLIIGFFGANQLNRNQINQSVSTGQAMSNTSPASPNTGAAVPAVAEAIERADKNPDDFAAQIKAGEMFARINNFEKAIPYFEKAEKIKPNDYQTLVIFGNVYFDAKKWLESARYYEKALVIKPDDLAVQTDYGITFVERESPDYDRAIQEFQKSIKLDPNHEPTLFNLSVAYYKKGDVKNAQDFKSKLKPDSDLARKLDDLFTMK
jgi:tetratricopeptide (TPR) repeat protein